MRYGSTLPAVLLSVMIFFASIGGTYATWYFAEDPASSTNDPVNITLSEFVWAPEEILPTVTPGQNYLDLHAAILNNNKSGLNSSKGALEDAIIEKGLLHSSHNLQGGNIKHLFITAASRELDFFIQYVSDTKFHLYMYKKEDTTNGAVGVTEIQVYMSILTKENEKWEGKESQVGYATLQYRPNSNDIAIDVTTWHR